MSNNIAIGKNQKIFVAPETWTDASVSLISRIASPAAATDGKQFLMLTAGEGSINQELEILDDKQLRNGRSKQSPIRGRYNAGKFTFPCYLKSVNTTGASNYFVNVPEIDMLLKSGFGTRPAVADTATAPSITYSCNSLKQPTFTMWVKKDHTVFIGVGATANSLKFDIKGSDVAMVTIDGEFMAMYKAGQSLLSGADVDIPAGTAGSATFSVLAGAGNRFDVGAFVEFYTPAGSAINYDKAGYQITAISTDAITVVPDLVTIVASGSTVRGYIPFSDDTSNVEVGVPLHGKTGQLRSRLTATGSGTTTAITVTDVTINFNNNIKYSNDEKNGSFYAMDFFNSDFRSIDGSMSLYFREADVKFWKDAFDQTEYELYIPVGYVDETVLAASGTIAKLSDTYAGMGIVIKLPHIEFKSPTISGENEITMKVDFQALSTNGNINDEISYTIV